MRSRTSRRNPCAGSKRSRRSPRGRTCFVSWPNGPAVLPRSRDDCSALATPTRFGDNLRAQIQGGSMTTVHYWVIRHGQRDGDKDALTEKGFEQVKASAKHNLSTIKFDAAFFSGMN